MENFLWFSDLHGFWQHLPNYNPIGVSNSNSGTDHAACAANLFSKSTSPKFEEPTDGFLDNKENFAPAPSMTPPPTSLANPISSQLEALTRARVAETDRLQVKRKYLHEEMMGSLNTKRDVKRMKIDAQEREAAADREFRASEADKARAHELVVLQMQLALSRGGNVAPPSITTPVIVVPPPAASMWSPDLSSFPQQYDFSSFINGK